jgi:hypothetical protein
MGVAFSAATRAPSTNLDPCRFGHGLTTEGFPAGLAQAPFLWNYFGGPYEWELLGGFVGVRQNPKNFGTVANLHARPRRSQPCRPRQT